MPRALLSQITTVRFEAARRLSSPPRAHHLRRLHGHSFAARAETDAAATDGAALHAALVRTVAALDYRDLNTVIDEPSDAALAAWIAREAQVRGWRSLTLCSAPEQHMSLESDGRTWLARRFQFEAAHRLPFVPDGHQCGRMHGHGFGVELCVALDGPEWIAAERLDRAWSTVQALVDHACLNDLDGLANPTSEIIAQWIWERLRPQLPELASVAVDETATAGSRYDGERFTIWKEQRFDAALRLAHAAADDPRARLHGHSYRVRLNLSAPLDDVLGWVVDFGDVKQLFASIYRQLDHQRIDTLPGLAQADCAGLLAWIRERTADIVPQLCGVELYERPGCGAKLVWE
jgi:6-pyruvoyltetrahydropterin/6-carboxytetrahydropterin synthase